MDVTETRRADAAAAEVPVVEIRLLGEPEVVMGGRVIVPTAGKQQVLLVALALERGRPVRPDELIDAL